MPGIFGFVSIKDNIANDEVILEKMLEYHRTLPIFQNFIHQTDNCYGGYSQPDLVYKSTQYFSSKDSVSVWFDGELFNQDELPLNEIYKKGFDATFILENYLSDNKMGFLRLVDGIFAAVIYDHNSQTILCVNDRYGLQHIHWIKNEEYFAWASEYKSFSILPGFKCHIDTSSLNDFISYGYILENRTWLCDANLLPPATILSFDLQSKKMKHQQYWSWNDIRLISHRVNEKECVEEWGRLFQKALERRIYPAKRIGITLSGGLDSRAILAAMPQTNDIVHTFTFGLKKCDDIQIANRVASLKGTEQHNCFLDISKWLTGNIAAVWAGDGEIALLDTNGNEYLSFMASHIDVCLNGFGGDALHGGSFLAMTDQHFNTVDDPYGFRGRRYIRQGFRYDQSYYHVRCPFYDNKLLEFQLSLPLEFRKKSHIYNKTLLHNYPSFFKTIPWQKAGVPISYPAIFGEILSFGKKTSSRILRAVEHFGLPLKDNRNYVNHLQRTLIEPGKTFLDELFKNPNALYPEFLKKSDVISFWENHLHGKYNVALVNRYATFEVWLQMLFKGEVNGYSFHNLFRK
jgi:asparagine synthase (glutamine-hydrolysing)